MEFRIADTFTASLARLAADEAPGPRDAALVRLGQSPPELPAVHGPGPAEAEKIFVGQAQGQAQTEVVSLGLGLGPQISGQGLAQAGLKAAGHFRGPPPRPAKHGPALKRRPSPRPRAECKSPGPAYPPGASRHPEAPRRAGGSGGP